MKRKANQDQGDPAQFMRDVKSLRAQAYESAQEGLVKGRSIKTAEDAIQFEQDVLFTASLLKNKVDSIYPDDSDCGEVVSMGTEECMACGLQEDPDNGVRLFEYEPTLLPKSKIDMKGDKTVVSVAAGGLHSVCLHRDGTVSSWGANDENALGWGNGDFEDELHFIRQMKSVKDVVQISAGDNHTTMLDIHGDVYGCGMYKDMDSGQFRELQSSNDTDIRRKTHAFPCKVLGLGKIKAIDAGNSWNAALDSDGSTLYTWGMGNSGQLARSKSMGAELIDETYIDSNGNDKCKYKTYDLKKKFMGTFSTAKNDKGDEFETYDYDTAKVAAKFMTPGPVEWAGGPVLKRQVLNFSCGDIHLLVVACNQFSRCTQVFSAGNSAFGQLGHGDTKEIHELTPIKALNDKQISKVAAGNFHSLAISMNGHALFSWGKIDSGALGLYDEDATLKYESTDYVAVPKRVTFPKTLGKSYLVDIAAGDTSSFAITEKGEVYSWGYNENSQTGHYNVPDDDCEPDDNGNVTDEHGNKPTNLISRPRLLNVIASVNDGLKRANEPVIAKNCRVTKVSGGGQHSVMVIKRYK